MKLAQFIERHPYRFVAIMEAVVVIAYLLTGTVAYFLGLSNMALYGLANLGLTLIVIVLLTRLRWWKTVGFAPLRRQGDLLFFLLPLIPVILNLIPDVKIESFAQVSAVFAVTLAVAFAEETIFRGLMLQAIKPLGYWRAAVITALLFGLTHAMNALTGKNMLESAMQIGYATAIGFAYAALALKKDALWLLILTHFLTDFAFFIQKPGFALSSFWQSFIVISLTITFDREDDGRWIAEIEALPGCLVYGRTRQEAARRA
ncbi:MAG TPA: CPBP family intramembrane metalloprotease, partial [Anaerolineales bacterium]|nr:CPBP family intramembrane metalloprotease [Anaerolineales bacterium]